MKLNLEIIRFHAEDVITTSESAGINYVPLSTISGYENQQHISLYSEYASIPNGYKNFRYTWYDSGAWYTEDKSWNEMASEYGLTTDPTGWRTSN